MKSIIKDRLLTLWVQIRDLYLYICRHAIIVNGYVDDCTWRGIRHRNWGDDLNYYFLRELTGRSVVMYHNFKLAKWLHLTNYMCIGTILDNKTNNSRCNHKTIVWGTGAVGLLWNSEKPEIIKAVRGQKTKLFLENNGFLCPNILGDPALLLPLVYQPKVETTKYRMGIIPHVADLHHPVIEEIRKNHANEVLIIDLAHYEKWTDVIDHVCSCVRILSSSLHGLIVSDAYQVPNCWIKLSEKIAGGTFKYKDYASSIDRHLDSSVSIDEFTNITDDMFSLADIVKIKEIQRGLIKASPFRLNSHIRV